MFEQDNKKGLCQCQGCWMGQVLSQLHNWDNYNMPSTRSKRNNVKPDVEIENVETKPKEGRTTTNKNTKEPISSKKFKGKLL